MQARTYVNSKTILATALALAAACSGQKAQPVDAGLANDLSLASQAQAYRQQQYVSPQELAAMQGYGQPGMYPNGYVPQPIPAGYAAGPYYAPAPAPAPQTRVVYRDRPVYSSRGGGGGGGYSTAGVYSAPRQTVKKNTKRDAAIGAAAGAAIGVATSARKDRLKGGLLGAVAGGVLGAVVGNNVDKHPIP